MTSVFAFGINFLLLRNNCDPPRGFPYVGVAHEEQQWQAA
jgi:hypothetical protein